MNLPKISVVMPTLNSVRTLEESLRSIKNQNYPKNKLEILILDGGSKDSTLKIAKKFGAKIYKNPLQTAEAGKAIGVKKASGELLAMIDSDNILPDKDWLLKMVKPLLEDKEILFSEPIRFEYRKEDSLISRYCTLLGASDPLPIFLGNHDKFSYLTGKWTEVERDEKDKGQYLKVKVNSQNFPTLGANGTIVRKVPLVKQLGKRKYLFDIDIFYELSLKKNFYFAKVKVGIGHNLAGNLSTYFRKNRRRTRDFLYYQKMGLRTYPWQKNYQGIFEFVVSTLLIFPLIIQSISGFLKKKDIAWILHLPAAWITLLVILISILQSKFKNSLESRQNWRQ